MRSFLHQKKVTVAKQPDGSLFSHFSGLPDGRQVPETVTFTDPSLDSTGVTIVSKGRDAYRWSRRRKQWKGESWVRAGSRFLLGFAHR